MGFFKSLFKTGKLNADPQQQALAKALLDAVENHGGLPMPAIYTILHNSGWSREEKGDRIVHATSMTKVWRPDLYPDVKKLAEYIYVSL